MTLRSVLVSTDGPFTLSLLAFTVTLSLGRPHGSCGHPQGWNTRFHVKSSSTHPLTRKQRERGEKRETADAERKDERRLTEEEKLLEVGSEQVNTTTMYYCWCSSFDPG